MSNRNERRASRRNLQKLLNAANAGGATTAVAFSCRHYTDPRGVVMSLETAIEHWFECRPFKVSTDLKELARTAIKLMSLDA